MQQNRPLYAQVIFVAIAFAIMIVLSYMFMRTLGRTNLVRTADGALDVTEARATSRLNGFKSATESFAAEVRGIIGRNGRAGALQAYIDDISRFSFLDGNAVSGMQDFFGYFETLPEGPAMLYGGSRSLPEEAKPKKSDWYRLAVQAGGAVVETTPSIGDGGVSRTSTQNAFWTMRATVWAWSA